ncbi:hypothetical protein MFMK1_003600 [Metallumcola ferriviriculae]|uniref:DUF4878 domain-containing protein n=1 Tax=Metallumcola ferriviriculae TaxID=3039180 RepID=A0AAU0UTM9_9FIRM|nr:hypothetical protein MFMK1_003600 [Desulfitibacteraceae bacterium MK1]
MKKIRIISFIMLLCIILILGIACSSKSDPNSEAEPVEKHLSDLSVRFIQASVNGDNETANKLIVPDQGVGLLASKGTDVVNIEPLDVTKTDDTYISRVKVEGKTETVILDISFENWDGEWKISGISMNKQNDSK